MSVEHSVKTKSHKLVANGLSRYNEPQTDHIQWLVYFFATSARYYGDILSPFEIPAFRNDIINILNEMGIDNYTLGRAWVLCEKEDDAIMLYMRYTC